MQIDLDGWSISIADTIDTPIALVVLSWVVDMSLLSVIPINRNHLAIRTSSEIQDLTALIVG